MEIHSCKPHPSDDSYQFCLSTSARFFCPLDCLVVFGSLSFSFFLDSEFVTQCFADLRFDDDQFFQYCTFRYTVRSFYCDDDGGGLVQVVNLSSASSRTYPTPQTGSRSVQYFRPHTDFWKACWSESLAPPKLSKACVIIRRQTSQ